LVKEPYTVQGTTVEEKVEELLDEMQKETDCIDYVSVFPVDLKIKKWDINGSMLDIYFDVKYNNIEPAAEVLLRAAVVQTITQLEEVKYVSFYAAGQPIVDGQGKEIGYQNTDDFVQNIGSTLHSYQKRDLQLYFVNTEGTMLEGEVVSVRYNSNMSVEKLIVEKLIEGPTISGHLATFSKETKVLGVSVKDGICYVNFDENFLSSQVVIDPKLTIYSLVNSIVDIGNATKVQFLVNGEANVKYKETIDLSQPFSRNLDIIEGEE